jgi:hypothetical protein
MWFPNSSSVIALSAFLWAGSAAAELRPFSLYGLAGWDEKTFFRVRPTEYKSVDEGRAQVIQSDCKESSSGYSWQQKMDLKTTPILKWRWKVDNLYPGLNEREKSGDDFPARVYVVTDGGVMFWSSRAIVYVWSNGEQGVEDWPSGYTDKVHVVAVRAGAEGLGQWQDQSRDLRADFKKYFDLEPESLAGVAIMSDCDDHKGSARAWFGDLILSEPR